MTWPAYFMQIAYTAQEGDSEQNQVSGISAACEICKPNENNLRNPVIYHMFVASALLLFLPVCRLFTGNANLRYCQMAIFEHCLGGSGSNACC